MKIDDIIGSFYHSLEVKFDKKINLWSIKLDENMLGSYSSCDIFDKSGDIILGLGKIINRKILKNMNRKQNFVKNPRFRNNGKFMLYSNALFSSILNDEKGNLWVTTISGLFMYNPSTAKWNSFDKNDGLKVNE